MVAITYPVRAARQTHFSTPAGHRRRCTTNAQRVKAANTGKPDLAVRQVTVSGSDQSSSGRSAREAGTDHARVSGCPAPSVYRAYLEQSQIFVGIYWQRYGWVAREETVSGLEDEYSLSAGMPRLLYVKAPAPAPERDERLTERWRGSSRTTRRPTSRSPHRRSW